MPASSILPRFGSSLFHSIESLKLFSLRLAARSMSSSYRSQKSAPLPQATPPLMVGLPFALRFCSNSDQLVSVPPEFWYTEMAVPTRNGASIVDMRYIEGCICSFDVQLAVRSSNAFVILIRKRACTHWSTSAVLARPDEKRKALHSLRRCDCTCLNAKLNALLQKGLMHIHSNR